jgi:hypothetical protein
MIRAVRDDVIRDIVRDSRRGVSQRSSLAVVPQSEPRPASGGSVPIQQPPGINYIDRMCEAQDRIDRLNAVRVRIETEMVEAAMENKIRYKAQTEYNPYSRERMGFDDDED